MGNRMEKIDAELQRTISKIVNEDLRNPLLDDCVITICSVKTSADLSQCKVFVSVVNTDLSKETIISELSKSAGFVKKEVADILDLKRTPNINFIYDDSLEEGDRILKLIEELNKKK